MPNHKSDPAGTESKALNASEGMPGILDFLRLKLGVYAGEGRNHQNGQESFLADFHIKMIAGGNGVQISFRAKDREMIFHEERTWIAPDLVHERLCLWTISSNAPGVLKMELRKDESSAELERALTFGFGEISNNDRFREEIRLEFLKTGEARYIYSWGTPGEDFALRSTAIVHHKELPLPPSWL